MSINQQDPNFIQTLKNFYAQKNQKYDENLQNFCNLACNNNSKICSIQQANTQNYHPDFRALEFKQSIKKLLQLTYIKSNLSSNYDIIVNCQSCENNTQGKRCNTCRPGYYDRYQLDRLNAIRDFKNSYLQDYIDFYLQGSDDGASNFQNFNMTNGNGLES